MESRDILLSALLGNEGCTKVDKMARNKWTRKKTRTSEILEEEQ